MTAVFLTACATTPETKGDVDWDKVERDVDELAAPVATPGRIRSRWDAETNRQLWNYTGVLEQVVRDERAGKVAMRDYVRKVAAAARETRPRCTPWRRWRRIPCD